MAYAVIENGVVIDRVGGNPQVLFNPAYAARFVEVADDVLVGWVETETGFAPPPLTLADYEQALTLHLDTVAQSRRYDNRITCALRAGFDGPFKAEGIAFAQWMDACNAIGYNLLANFEQGLIEQPSIDEFIAALPPMVWPV